LLVNADFFASEFITSNELPRILKAAEQDGATILTIILKPCAFELSKLSEYQALNSPNHPVSKMDENGVEELWASTVRQVIKIIES